MQYLSISRRNIFSDAKAITVNMRKTYTKLFLLLDIKHVKTIYRHGRQHQSIHGLRNVNSMNHMNYTTL